jgi:hypothetical protein
VTIGKEVSKTFEHWLFAMAMKNSESEDWSK